MNYLQDNVLASSNLVHNSIDELSRAINAAETTLSNAINAFGQLNYTKFLENVKICQDLIYLGCWRHARCWD